MLILDKYGYPVEYAKGRPINRIIRYVLHGDIIKTLTGQKDYIFDRNNGGWRRRSQSQNLNVTGQTTMNLTPIEVSNEEA